MNQKTLLSFVLCSLFYTSSFSQMLTLGLGLGMAEYVGDLNYSMANPNEWGNSVEISASYHFNSRWQLQMSLTQGKVMGDDAYADDPNLMQRNLHFKSNLTELGMMLKCNILTEPKLQVYSKAKTHFTPYLFGGVAVFSHNPKAQLDGKWIELQPLGTEGQYIPDSGLKPYSRFQLSIPSGLGISYRMRKIVLSLEMGYRLTFTDYLDDVSGYYPDQSQLTEISGSIASQLSRRSETYTSAGDRRGNRDANDAYFFSMFKVGYVFGR